MAIKLRKFSKKQSAEELEKWAYKVARDYNSEIKGILESGGSKSQILAAMDEEIKKICKQLDKNEDREFSEDSPNTAYLLGIFEKSHEYLLKPIVCKIEYKMEYKDKIFDNQDKLDNINGYHYVDHCMLEYDENEFKKRFDTMNPGGVIERLTGRKIDGVDIKVDKNPIKLD